MLLKGSVEFKQKSVSGEIERDLGKGNNMNNDKEFLFQKLI